MRRGMGASGMLAHREPIDVVGLVLAGGRSSRMGRDKALLPVDGEPLLLRQLGVLRDGGIERLMVAIGHRESPGVRLTGAGVETVQDRAPHGGPLAGIVVAMERVPRHPLFVLAVDMPHVTSRLVRELLSHAMPDVGVVPTLSGHWEPLCAVYPAGVLEVAERHLRSGARSPSQLAGELADSGRLRALPLGPERAHEVRSWNRPEDVTRPGGTTGT